MSLKGYSVTMTFTLVASTPEHADKLAHYIRTQLEQDRSLPLLFKPNLNGAILYSIDKETT